MSRILVAAGVSAVATLGAWLLLIGVAWVIVRLVGSLSSVASLMHFGLPLSGLLVAPLAAGIAGGLATGPGAGVLGSVGGLVIVGYVIDILLLHIDAIGIGVFLGVPLVMAGHLAGAAMRRPGVRSA